MIRPIPFSGDMVCAILDGRKTQTRRPVKPPFEMHANGYLTRPDGHGGRLGPYPCPYGQPGDYLWVREPGRVVEVSQSEEESVHFFVEYLADKKRRGFHLPERFDPLETNVWPSWVKEGRSIPNGIFREACRLVLEVVSVRVERLRDITEEGALMEGSFLGRCPCSEMRRKPRVPIEAAFRQTGCYIHGIEFKTLWDSIYSAKGRGWDANPWVWVVGFKTAAVGNEAAQAVMRAAA